MLWGVPFRCVGLYHQQLSYCIVQYIEKDPNTAIAVLRGLFKYWPWSSASKQVYMYTHLPGALFVKYGQLYAAK